MKASLLFAQKRQIAVWLSLGRKVGVFYGSEGIPHVFDLDRTDVSKVKYFKLAFLIKPKP